MLMKSNNEFRLLQKLLDRRRKRENKWIRKREGGGRKEKEKRHEIERSSIKAGRAGTCLSSSKLDGNTYEVIDKRKESSIFVKPP